MRGVQKGMAVPWAVPGLTYTLETMTWTVNDLNSLEVVQNMIGRAVLGANKYSM